MLWVEQNCASEKRPQSFSSPEAGGNPRHGERDEVVEVSIGGSGQLQGPEADVVQGLVVDAERLVRVLDQLVHGEGGVVGLHHGVRDLG